MLGDREERLDYSALFFRDLLATDDREAIDTTADSLIEYYDSDQTGLRQAIEHVTIHHGPKAVFGLCITMCYRIAESTGVSLDLIRSGRAHFAFELTDADSDSIVNPDQYASISEMVAFRMVIAVCNSDLAFGISLWETTLATESNDSGMDSLLWTLTKLAHDISSQQSPGVT